MNLEQLAATMKSINLLHYTHDYNNLYAHAKNIQFCPACLKSYKGPISRVF